MKMRFPLLLLLFALACASPLLADDWQWRGPDRTGISKETGLLQSWPKDGPPLLWTYKDAGLGFSSPAVVGDRLYTLGARDGTSFVIAVDVKSGKELWSAKLGPMFTFKGNTWGDGPRSTPTVDGGLIYALGGYGDLVCVDANGGKEVWRMHLAKDLDGEMMTQWGYSESPLVDGDKLVCCPGGAKGTLAALDKKTGKVIWRSKGLTDKATYSSLRIAEFGKIRQYVAMTYTGGGNGGAVAGVAADDGRLLWYQPWFKSDSYAVAMTPILHDDLIYVSEEFAGCRLLQVTPEADGKFKVTNLYKAPKIQNGVKNVHGGMLLVGKEVYGHAKRSGWVCQDLKTGKVLWDDASKLECSSGSLIAADGRLYLYSDEGAAVLLKPSPQGWEETGRFELPQKSKLSMDRPTFISAKVWTYPALADGRLYLRDQELLFCFDVRAQK